jgi:hypothetical protein
MAHFAKLDENNVVIDVNVVTEDDILHLPFPESEAVGVEFLTNWSGGYTNWKQTSYNRNFRKNYAHIGGKYDPDLDAFIEPQPFPSWKLNLYTCIWEPPVACPESRDNPLPGVDFVWNEYTLSWDQVNE